MPTISEILADASLVDALLELDYELCAQVKARGCPYCGETLDAAHYDRKPRGGPLQLDQAHARRLSLCCRREGCRSRVLPPSVRFLGRRVYLSVVVVLAAVLSQGPSPWRVTRLTAVLGADRRTLRRWRTWWTERVGKSRAFEVGRASFMPPPEATSLPRSLLESFVGTASERLVRALSFLAEHFGSRFPRDEVLSAELAR